MKPLSGSRPGPRQAWLVPLLVLVLVSSLLMLYKLDGTAFRNRFDDVDRSLIARNMVTSGDWLVPHYLGNPLYTKPPLMYWTAAALGRLTGRRDELPGNLTSVLSMLVVVLATFWSGRNLLGTGTGLRAGLLLTTMFLFLAMSRQALLDSTLMAGFALSFGSLIHLTFTPARHRTVWWLLFCLGLACGLLTKGPVLLPLVALIWLPLAWNLNQGRPSWWQVGLGVLLVMALILPWPLLVARSAPEAVEVWKSEFFGRFGEGRQFHAWTQQPFWFFGPDLIHSLPWLPLILVGLVHAWFRKYDPRFLMLLTWGLGGLLFFSLASATKRSYYLLPLYPAFALLAAAAWDDFAERARQHRSTGRLQVWTYRLTLALVGILGLALLTGPFRYPGLPRPAFLLGGGLATAAALAALFQSRQGNWIRALHLALAGTVALYLAWFGHFTPLQHMGVAGRPFFQEAASIAETEEVFLYKVPIATAVFYMDGAAWRYGHEHILQRAVTDSTGILVVTRPHIANRFKGLAEILAREYQAPFGKTRSFGLYRAPSKEVNHPE